MIYSKDWHPKNHISFFENLYAQNLTSDFQAKSETIQLFSTVRFQGHTEMQTLWPRHCVQDSDGAKISKALQPLPTKSIIITKGENPEVDSYSVFSDNQGNSTGYAEELLKAGVTELVVVGLALDFCVAASAIDGIKFGFYTTVLNDLSRAVNIETVAEKIKDIRDKTRIC